MELYVRAPEIPQGKKLPGQKEETFYLEVTWEITSLEEESHSMACVMDPSAENSMFTEIPKEELRWRRF